MNIKITYGDIVRHMNDYELAEFLVLEKIKVLAQALQAEGDKEKMVVFAQELNENVIELIKEHLSWLKSTARIKDNDKEG